MGVTINFQGQLKSDDNFKNIIITACEFAKSNEMPYSIFEEENKLLERVKNQQKWDYKGLTRGIRIQPHLNSDPLNLEFDKDLIIQEYCKTQYSGVEIHIKIINFLHQIESEFKWLEVVDEGQFWETNQTQILQNHFDKCFELIEEEQLKNSNLSGPFRIADGRIIDLMEN